MKKTILAVILSLAGIGFNDAKLLAQSCAITNLSGGYDLCVSAPNNNILLTASGPCGAGMRSWASSPAGIVSLSGSTTASESVTALSSGVATITYLVGGVDKAYRTVTVHALPSVTITGTSNVCHSGTPTVTLNGTPVSGGVWTASNGDATIGSATGIVTGVNIGSVDITYTVTDVYGCVDYDTHAMTIDPDPVAGIISGPTMMWLAVAGISTFSTTGSVGTSGAWSSSVPAVGSIDPSTGDAMGQSVGTTDIIYTATNSCGSDPASVSVTMNPYPIPGNNSFDTRYTIPSCGTVQGLNTAMINSSGIIAIVYWDGSDAKLLVHNYNYTSTYSNSPISLSATPIGLPDVIIGNGTTANASSDDDYTVAVAYPTAGGVVVDYFELFDDGVEANFTIASTASETFTHSSIYVNTVHIDGVYDYSNINGNSYPDCWYAVVVWDETNTGEVYADHISLHASSGSLTPQLIDYGKDPDVAAVSRGTGSNVDWALITYTDASNDNLYYTEWDVTTTPGSPITLDGMTGGSKVAVPRIDAIDDYTLNGTSSPTVALYKIAAEVDNNSTGFYEIRTYDNLLYSIAPGTYWTSSNTLNLGPITSTTPLYDHHTPTVALNTYDYTITHFTHDGSDDMVLMEPVAIGNPDALANGENYWVSETTYATTSGIHAVASSASCNSLNCALMVWAYPYSSGCGFDTKIQCKVTPLGTYYFKPGQEPAKEGEKRQAWDIYPNPAKEYLAVTAHGKDKTGTYEISDMLGRALLRGDIKNGPQRLNISELATGTYILRINGLDGAYKAEMFVKE